ncbi:Synapsin [Papilio machaon]|uniref:Synapsin n=1 Tax=Papilio machaon TaxID=76193 RepID=A0A194R2F0_PAPMA|nr:Synapsin [Papilio machaon]
MNGNWNGLPIASFTAKRRRLIKENLHQLLELKLGHDDDDFIFNCANRGAALCCYAGLGAVKIDRSGCPGICGPQAATTSTLSFSSFRNSFTSNVNYLKRSSVEALRRFSSGDLQSECDEGEVDPYTGRPATTSQPKPQPQHQRPVSQATGGSIGSASSVSAGSTGGAGVAGPGPAGGDLSLNLRGGSRGTSAPSSPAKSRESLLQRVQSLTGAARDQGANLLGSVTSVASVGRGYNRDRCVTLLVVDDQNTDWSKYFRGRRLPGEWDIRVEQAEFKELSVTASSDGANVSMSVYRSGTKVTRCFKPDFVLVRQNVRDAGADHRALLLGLKFGGVPSINSLNSIYHFQDRPWVFGHLLQLQRRLGRENFPLIEQTYYHNYSDMVTSEFSKACRDIQMFATINVYIRCGDSSHRAIEVRLLQTPRECGRPVKQT